MLSENFVKSYEPVRSSYRYNTLVMTVYEGLHVFLHA